MYIVIEKSVDNSQGLGLKRHFCYFNGMNIDDEGMGQLSTKSIARIQGIQGRRYKRIERR